MGTIDPFCLVLGHVYAADTNLFQRHSDSLGKFVHICGGRKQGSLAENYKLPSVLRTSCWEFSWEITREEYTEL